jgi:hypothetical protein
MVAQLTNLLSLDERIVALQGGLNGPLLTAENVYEKLKRMAEAMGLKGVERYYTDPSSEGDEQPPEEPVEQAADPMAEAQMGAELEIQKARIAADADIEIGRINAERDIILGSMKMGMMPEEVAQEPEYVPDGMPAMEGEEYAPAFDDRPIADELDGDMA